jgi:hypothetical protein
VSVSNCLPGTGRCRRTNVREVDGRQLDVRNAPTVGVHYVTPRHLELLRTPLVRGRTFDERDSAGSTRVAIVDEAATARLWPGEDPLGRRLALHFANGLNTEPREVIGVVRHIQFDPVEAIPLPDVYVPASQLSWSAAVVYVRTPGRLDSVVRAVRAGIADIDPAIAVHDPAPLETRLGAGFAVERLLSVVLLAFAAAALVLAGIGIHALIAHAVGQSRREIAIRMALGSTRSQVIGLIAGRTGALACLGLTLGIPGARIAGRLLSSTAGAACRSRRGSTTSARTSHHPTAPGSPSPARRSSSWRFS